MANRIQHLRGSDTEHSTFTGEKGEISLVTDTSSNRIPTGELRIHDGSTAGGLPVKLGTSSKPLTNDIYLASGTGINFSAYGSEDSNSATTVGNNLLDDYEEGTWTLVVTQAGYTLSTASASYTKIGNMVNIRAVVAFSAIGSSTSQFAFSGLPFTPSETNAGVGREDSAIGHLFSVRIDSSPSVNSMDGVSSGSTVVFATSRDYIFNCTYRTS